jgi:hypothetical protein
MRLKLSKEFSDVFMGNRDIIELEIDSNHPLFDEVKKIVDKALAEKLVSEIEERFSDYRFRPLRQ